MWKSIYEEGKTGSENGLIIIDEEYKGSCRITLEKCERYYAITCGIYGGMVHTALVNEDRYKEMYENMKQDLQEFIEKKTSYDEEIQFYENFASKYI